MRLSRLLLTSASLVTLSVASIGRAVAGTTVAGQTGAYNVSADADWINVDTSNISTFTNNRNITDGFDNPDDPDPDAIALHVRATNPLISTLINGAAGNITAIEDESPGGNNVSTSAATATALLIDGAVPHVVNLGTIRAIAIAHAGNATTSASAQAAGYVFDGNDRNVATNDLVNNGLIRASATALAVALTTSALAEAAALGVGQRADHSGGGGAKSLLSLTNAGTISVDARASAVGGSHACGCTPDFAARARAVALGVLQQGTNAAIASALVANTGSIVAHAHGGAVAQSNLAFATYVAAAGVLQSVSGRNTLASDDASATVTNGGGGVIHAIADANEPTCSRPRADAREFAFALARALMPWTSTYPTRGDATAIVQNSGSIIAEANARAQDRANLCRGRPWHCWSRQPGGRRLDRWGRHGDPPD